jgi:hypothetical protein
MDIKDQIKHIADRVIKLKDQITTVEATKNAFILPFLQCLGYDVFNPLEVVTEYLIDTGFPTKKIDYAIIQDGNPTILIKCMHWIENLDVYDGQLPRDLQLSKARLGILTNGINYRFYFDLETPNEMHEKPFLQFTITELKDETIEEINLFHRDYFDIDKIIDTLDMNKNVNEQMTLKSQTKGLRLNPKSLERITPTFTEVPQATDALTMNNFLISKLEEKYNASLEVLCASGKIEEIFGINGAKFRVIITSQANISVMQQIASHLKLGNIAREFKAVRTAYYSIKN